MNSANVQIQNAKTQEIVGLKDHAKGNWKDDLREVTGSLKTQGNGRSLDGTETC